MERIVHHSHWHNSSFPYWLSQFFLTWSTFHLSLLITVSSDSLFIFWCTTSFFLDLESLWTFMRYFHIILWCIFYICDHVHFQNTLPCYGKLQFILHKTIQLSTPLLALCHSIYLLAKSITPISSPEPSLHTSSIANI